VDFVAMLKRLVAPPEFPLGSLCSVIVHQLSGPIVCTLSPPYRRAVGMGRYCA